jgi:hypothetical protein
MVVAKKSHAERTKHLASGRALNIQKSNKTHPLNPNRSDIITKLPHMVHQSLAISVIAERNMVLEMRRSMRFGVEMYAYLI